MKKALTIIAVVLCIGLVGFTGNIQPELLWDCYAETKAKNETNVFLSIVAAKNKKDAERIFDKWVISLKKPGKIDKSQKNYSIQPIIEQNILRK
jgi:hypothetical protein